MSATRDNLTMKKSTLTPNEHRRDLLTGLSLTLAGVTLPALSQESKAPSEPKRPFRVVNAPEDAQRVILFFDFACSYCAAYHEGMSSWAATVPPKIQTLFIPVVNINDPIRRNEMAMSARCYYAAFSVATRPQMSKFLASMYAARANGQSLSSAFPWSRAAREAGINPQAFLAAFKGRVSVDQVPFAARKTQQYALKATPSIGVGGRYVMTPDDVLGNQEMFYNVLNGLTSEIL
jgi:thiol:disulfide interchange protein DsbA